MKNTCAIIIPIYKPTLNCVEEIALNRLKNVIGTSRDIYLIAPDNLDTTAYDNIYGIHLNTIYFPQYYFESTATYSHLCLNYNFYNEFSDYEYMLIYQLDCYLFSDEIDFWCSKGYDYIGPPILSTDCGWNTVVETVNGKKYKPMVGNGGFSLRKIETFKYLTQPDGEFYRVSGVTQEMINQVVYEDKYFCNDLYKYYDLYVPDWTEALEFGLDMSVDIIYDLYKMNPTPMGAHSIEKNIRYWQHVIPEFMDKNVIQYCENKHAEFFKLYYNEYNHTWRE